MLSIKKICYKYEYTVQLYLKIVLQFRRFKYEGGATKIS